MILLDKQRNERGEAEDTTGFAFLVSSCCDWARRRWFFHVFNNGVLKAFSCQLVALRV